MATVAIDLKAYGKLLAETKPTVIHNDEEHAAAMEHIAELAEKQDKATPEEIELMNLLATLIEDYEEKRWPRKREKSSPREILGFLMKENGLAQSDLTDVTPQSNISAILAGKRSIGPAVAVKLGKRFRVNPELFLDL